MHWLLSFWSALISLWTIWMHTCQAFQFIINTFHLSWLNLSWPRIIYFTSGITGLRGEIILGLPGRVYSNTQCNSCLVLYFINIFDKLPHFVFYQSWFYQRADRLETKLASGSHVASSWPPWRHHHVKLSQNKARTSPIAHQLVGLYAWLLHILENLKQLYAWPTMPKNCHRVSDWSNGEMRIFLFAIWAN